jgi:hypothetical protein
MKECVEDIRGHVLKQRERVLVMYRLWGYAGERSGASRSLSTQRYSSSSSLTKESSSSSLSSSSKALHR